MPFCECGCGQSFDYAPGGGRTRRFLPGHQFRTPEAIEARRFGKIRQRKTPPPGYPTHGFCLCGCGQRTTIAKESNRSTHSYAGCPMRYVRGHAPQPRGPESASFVGRRHMQTGYVYIYSPSHPKALTRGGFEGYVLEHRIVWEEANGRLLRDNECVHHINGIRDDNRPENLVALTSSAHARVTAAGRAPVADNTRQKLSAATHATWERRRRGELPMPKGMTLASLPSA